MFKPFAIYLCMFLVFMLQFQAKGQKFEVSITSIGEIDNKLVIKYDFQKSKSSQRFLITLEITNTEGYPIPVKTLIGDIGDNVSGGTNKQIIWDYNADKIVMQQDINIQVVAYLKGEQVGTPKALLLSTAWPGLGIYKTDRSKPYWIIGLAGYGSLGASYYFNKKANDNYNAYIENTVDEQNDVLLSKSQDQDKISKTFAYTAIGIWGINLVWTAIKAKRVKQKGLAVQKNQNLFFYTGYNPYNKIPEFTIKFNF